MVLVLAHIISFYNNSYFLDVMIRRKYDNNLITGCSFRLYTILMVFNEINFIYTYCNTTYIIKTKLEINDDHYTVVGVSNLRLRFPEL